MKRALGENAFSLISAMIATSIVSLGAIGMANIATMSANSMKGAEISLNHFEMKKEMGNVLNDTLSCANSGIVGIKFDPDYPVLPDGFQISDRAGRSLVAKGEDYRAGWAYDVRFRDLKLTSPSCEASSEYCEYTGLLEVDAEPIRDRISAPPFKRSQWVLHITTEGHDPGDLAQIIACQANNPDEDVIYRKVLLRKVITLWDCGGSSENCKYRLETGDGRILKEDTTLKGGSHITVEECHNLANDSITEWTSDPDGLVAFDGIVEGYESLRVVPDMFSRGVIPTAVFPQGTQCNGEEVEDGLANFRVLLGRVPASQQQEEDK